jgi:hypothetical protein
MKIRVRFTLDVAPEDLPALRTLAGGVETNAEARAFVVADAAEYAADYLSNNDVTVNRIIYADGTTS